MRSERAAKRPTTTAAGARRRQDAAAAAGGRAAGGALCQPKAGTVSWNDLVKGPISIHNEEIDDLIILRADGVPTYNFAVVVDDWDMRSVRLPRRRAHQQHALADQHLQCAWAPLPQFGHMPIILGDDGLKLSKRRGAVSVIAYEENGYLPEAMLNYLAAWLEPRRRRVVHAASRWSQWFDGSHLAKSPRSGIREAQPWSMRTT
jgi:glutamyl-tRNA synthetase